MELTPRDIEIVKSTAPALADYGVEITTRMYQILFERHPEARAFFNSAANQPAKLAAAIVAYAKHVDNMSVLEGAATKIAQAHVDSSVMPEHYPLVADALISAIGEVLGAAATDEVVNAWTNAFNYLAGILQDKEASLYSQRTLKAVGS